MRNAEDTTPSATSGETSGEVGVLNKSLDLVEVLAGNEAMTIADLSERSGVNKPAAYRILKTLERRGYAMRVPGEVRRYSLGPAIRTLSRESVSPGDLLSAARPHMKRLWEEFDETVNLGVLSDERVLYLDILESAQGLRTSISVGTHDYLHSTALGKAMLAELEDSHARDLLTTKEELSAKTPETITSVPRLIEELESTRQRGFALDDEENEPGARCIASAVRAPGNGLLGALSVSAPKWRMDDDMVHRIGQRLRELSGEINDQLG